MKIDNMIVREQGFSAIGMVLILFMLGIVLIAGGNQMLFLAQERSLNQKQYYKDLNYALSSISWAITQNWLEPNENWYCQKDQSANLIACIKKSKLSTNQYTIIMGQSGRVKRYHLANYSEGQLIIKKGHWLDYCPENRRNSCD